VATKPPGRNVASQKVGKNHTDMRILSPKTNSSPLRKGHPTKESSSNMFQPLIVRGELLISWSSWRAYVTIQLVPNIKFKNKNAKISW